MNDGKSLRRQFKAAGANLAANSEPHPGDEALIDYCQQRLGEADRLKIQSHLAACDSCLATYHDVRDFCQPRTAAEPPVTAAEIASAWQRLWREVKPPSVIERPAIWPARRWLALAAALLVMIALPGIWALSLRQSNGELARNLAAEQQRRQQEIARLEAENRALKEQSATRPPQPLAAEVERLTREKESLARQQEALRSEYESLLAQSKKPLVNVPVFDLLPRDMSVRSASPDDFTPINLNRDTRNYTLILNGAELPAHNAYRIEILDTAGRLVWQGGGLRRDRDGNIIISLNREFLTNGSYRFLVYAATPSSKPLAEYLITLAGK